MIKTCRTKRTFYPEFKLEAIEQVVKYQCDVREVALALELNPDHLRKWIRLYKQELQGIEPASNTITPEQREIQQLKAPCVPLTRGQVIRRALSGGTALALQLYSHILYRLFLPEQCGSLSGRYSPVPAAQH